MLPIHLKGNSHRQAMLRAVIPYLEGVYNDNNWTDSIEPHLFALAPIPRRAASLIREGNDKVDEYCPRDRSTPQAAKTGSQ